MNCLKIEDFWPGVRVMNPKAFLSSLMHMWQLSLVTVVDWTKLIFCDARMTDGLVRIVI